MKWNSDIDTKVLNMLCELGETAVDSINSFYHYTTMDGVKGIFNSYIKRMNKCPNSSAKVQVDECSLRASNVRFLNDSMEYKEGVETLKGVINTLDEANLNENIYTISFCQNGNLLSQWDRYGKNSGIAIEFDFGPNTKLGYLKQIKRNKEEKEAPCRWKYVPINVEYVAQDELYRRIKEQVDLKITGDNTDEIANAIFVPLCKNVGFKQEEESRIILYSCPMDNFIYDMDYIVNENLGTVKPSLNVQVKNEEHRNIIKSLTVGPGKNQNLIFNALVHIFDRENYHFYDDDQIADWGEKDNLKLNQELYTKDRNYYFASSSGQLVTMQDIENKPLTNEIEYLETLLKAPIDHDAGKDELLNNAIMILKRERKRIISEELKKESMNNYIVHRCKNGIFIKKSLIPYRG